LQATCPLYNFENKSVNTPLAWRFLKKCASSEKLQKEKQKKTDRGQRLSGRGFRDEGHYKHLNSCRHNAKTLEVPDAQTAKLTAPSDEAQANPPSKPWRRVLLAHPPNPPGPLRDANDSDDPDGVARGDGEAGVLQGGEGRVRGTRTARRGVGGRVLPQGAGARRRRSGGSEDLRGTVPWRGSGWLLRMGQPVHGVKWRRSDTTSGTRRPRGQGMHVMLRAGHSRTPPPHQPTGGWGTSG